MSVPVHPLLQISQILPPARTIPTSDLTAGGDRTHWRSYLSLPSRDEIDCRTYGADQRHFPSPTGLFTPFCFLVSYASDQGVPSRTAFYVLAVLNAASVLGRIAPAHFADAFGRFALLVPCAFLAGLSTALLWPAAHSLAPLLAYAALYGLFSGAFNALIVPCIAQISDIREIGMRIGLLYSIISFP